MKPNLLFFVSAAYLAISGLGFLFSPDSLLYGALANASAPVVAGLRGLGAMLFSVAVLNWLARNLEASKAKDAIFLSNTVGFALTTITIATGAVGGGTALLWVNVVITALFAIAFFVVGRANMSTA